MSRFRLLIALAVVAPLATLAACSDPAPTVSAQPAGAGDSPSSVNSPASPTIRTPVTTSPVASTSVLVRATAKPVSSTPKPTADAWPSHFTELPNGIYCGEIVETAVQDNSFTFKPWTYRSKAGAEPVKKDRKIVLLGLTEDPVIEMPKADDPHVLQNVVPLLGLRQAMQLVGAWDVASFDLQVVNHDVVRISQQDATDNYEGHCS